VVPDLDRVFDVLERDDAVSDFGGGFAGREKVFENLNAAFSQLCAEAFED